MKRKGLEAAKELIKCGVSDALRYELEKDYPELKESEDERIRKWIIENIQETLDINGFFEGQKTIAENAITWLKKQGKQKPAWSEEDECYMSECIGAIATKDGWSFEEKRKTKHWLKSLKDRILPQPKQEWGEKDESHLIHYVRLINNAEGCSISEQENAINWLKSIKERMKGE